VDDHARRLLGLEGDMGGAPGLDSKWARIVVKHKANGSHRLSA
jgi:hypothetical protein